MDSGCRADAECLSLFDRRVTVRVPPGTFFNEIRIYHASRHSREEELPGVLRLRMGTIDTPTDAKPVAHIFATNLPAWAAMDDDLPRYEKLEPTR